MYNISIQELVERIEKFEYLMGERIEDVAKEGNVDVEDLINTMFL